MKKRLLVASLCVMFSFVANVILAQSFKQGEKLTWTTSADKGEFWVSWKSGNRFGLDQTNKNNPAAGVVKMTGEYRGGKYYISNPEYGEEWVGTERNGVISGRINGQMSFKITRQSSYGGNSGSSSSSYYGKSIFTYGKKLYWSSDRDKGTLKVTWASGNNFRLDQTNYNNPGAGVVKLNGEYRNGKYYISNPEYGENWVGTERNGTISGNINGGVSFKISTTSYGNSNSNNNSNSYSRNFFTYGKKLYWKSDNNIGEMKVTWATGDRFNIDQKNYNAPGAGTIKMTGEYRNGTYYISCVRYNEEWIGTERGGTVSGKVNNRVNFKISTSSYGYNNSNNNNNSSNNNYSSILKVGKRFKWNNGNNEGLIIVKSVSGSDFVIEQSNYDNPSAGWVKMNGSFRNGVYTIYNPKWNETWRLQERYGKLEGKVNNSINIVLTPTSSSSSSNGNSSNSASPGYRPNNNYEDNKGRIGDDIIR